MPIWAQVVSWLWAGIALVFVLGHVTTYIQDRRFKLERTRRFDMTVKTIDTKPLKGEMLGYHWICRESVGMKSVDDCTLEFGCEKHTLREWGAPNFIHSMCVKHLGPKADDDTMRQHEQYLARLVHLCRGTMTVEEKPKRVPTSRGLALARLYEAEWPKAAVWTGAQSSVGLGLAEHEARALVMEDLEKEILADKPGYVKVAQIDTGKLADEFALRYEAAIPGASMAAARTMIGREAMRMALSAVGIQATTQGPVELDSEALKDSFYKSSSEGFHAAMKRVCMEVLEGKHRK